MSTPTSLIKIRFCLYSEIYLLFIYNYVQVHYKGTRDYSIFIHKLANGTGREESCLSVRFSVKVFF